MSLELQERVLVFLQEGLQELFEPERAKRGFNHVYVLSNDGRVELYLERGSVLTMTYWPEWHDGRFQEVCRMDLRQPGSLGLFLEQAVVWLKQNASFLPGN